MVRPRPHRPRPSVPRYLGSQALARSSHAWSALPWRVPPLPWTIARLHLQVVFLRDGSRIELSGVEKYKEIEDHIKRCIFTM